MIVKVIQHNNMTRSANYLYQKAQNDSNNAGADNKYLPHKTCDEFLENVKELKSLKSFERGKEQKLNNQIKHLVLAFHPNDREKFVQLKDTILQELFEELGINPENHLANIFIHNDRSHPHIHVLFSRIGEDLSVFKDNRIGVRMGDFAKKISNKYDLIFENPQPKIRLSSKELFNPTLKGDLLKLIDFSVKEAKSLKEFQKIMKEHGVRTKVTNSGKIIYMTPNPQTMSKEEIGHFIASLKKSAKSQQEFKKQLYLKGIYLKIGEDGKEIFSLKKVTVWTEEMLPKAAGLGGIYKQVKTMKHNPEYLALREKLQNAISNCETLKDIKDILPGCEMKYQIKGNQIYNLTFHHENQVIKLHEVFIMDVKVDNRIIQNEFDIPIIFTPRFYDQHEEERQKKQMKKLSKKHKQIGFRIQI